MSYEIAYGLIPESKWGRVDQLISDKHPRSVLLPKLHNIIVDQIKNRNEIDEEGVCRKLYGISRSSKYSHLKRRLLRLVYDYGILLSGSLESRNNGPTSLKKINILKGIIGSRLAYSQRKFIAEQQLLNDTLANYSSDTHNTIERLLLLERLVKLAGFEKNSFPELINEYNKALDNVYQYSKMFSAYRKCSYYSKNDNFSNDKFDLVVSELKEAIDWFNIDTDNVQAKLIYYKSLILYYGLTGQYDMIEDVLENLVAYANKVGVTGEIKDGLLLTQVNLYFSKGLYDSVVCALDYKVLSSAGIMHVSIRNKLLLLYAKSLMLVSPDQFDIYFIERDDSLFIQDVDSHHKEKLDYVIALRLYLKGDHDDSVQKLNCLNGLFYESDEYKYGIRIVECLLSVSTNDYTMLSYRLDSLRKLIYSMPFSLKNSHYYIDCYKALKRIARAWESGVRINAVEWNNLFAGKAQQTYNSLSVFPGGRRLYFDACLDTAKWIKTTTTAERSRRSRQG